MENASCFSAPAKKRFFGFLYSSHRTPDFGKETEWPEWAKGTVNIESITVLSFADRVKVLLTGKIRIYSAVIVDCEANNSQSLFTSVEIGVR